MSPTSASRIEGIYKILVSAGIIFLLGFMLDIRSDVKNMRRELVDIGKEMVAVTKDVEALKKGELSATRDRITKTEHDEDLDNIWEKAILTFRKK